MRQGRNAKINELSSNSNYKRVKNSWFEGHYLDKNQSNFYKDVVWSFDIPN
jgi:hypothetical protein